TTKILTFMNLLSKLPVGKGLDHNFTKFLKSAERIKSVSRRFKDKLAEAKINTAFENTGILKVTGFEVKADPQRSLSTRYIVNFQPNHEFVKHFILIRGLFEFSRPGSIKLVANIQTRSFDVEVSHLELEYFLSYVNIIADSFKKEMRFKNALRQVIAFEENIKKQQEHLYLNVHQSLL